MDNNMKKRLIAALSIPVFLFSVSSCSKNQEKVFNDGCIVINEDIPLDRVYRDVCNASSFDEICEKLIPDFKDNYENLIISLTNGKAKDVYSYAKTLIKDIYKVKIVEMLNIPVKDVKEIKVTVIHDELKIVHLDVGLNYNKLEKNNIHGMESYNEVNITEAYTVYLTGDIIDMFSDKLIVKDKVSDCKKSMNYVINAIEEALCINPVIGKNKIKFIDESLIDKFPKLEDGKAYVLHD